MGVMVGEGGCGVIVGGIGVGDGLEVIHVNVDIICRKTAELGCLVISTVWAEFDNCRGCMNARQSP